MAGIIRENRTATGATAVARVLACDLVVTGVFVGTWQFQVLLNDEWTTVAGGTDVGGAYLDVSFAEPRQVRFNVPALTSGTIGFNLAGRDFRALR